MSAWYIFSALGFYPVCPGSDDYILGSPLVQSAKIHLENGSVIEITAKNQSEKNSYVKAVYLNGVKMKDFKLSFQNLKNGGKLVFEMTGKPAKTF